MLTEKTIALVKATAPVLEQHGETLTRHFYQRMFTHNPEVAPFFNPAHQTAGTQQRALAGAICAYAANIDNLDVLGGAVELIAQKHASLQIQPEHYPIVGENLLASIREVLGAAATEDIIQAWAEAYGFLAKILIGREREIYHQNETKAGGWSGFKKFRVDRKKAESDVITSFYLVPADGTAPASFKPGQYTTARVVTPNGTTTMRNYSLSDKPGQPWYRISVKRESGPDATKPEGFVSNYLHDRVNAGDTLELGAPCGEFFIDHTENQRPLVLISGGVGITPVMSMFLSTLDVAPNRPIFFIHAALNSRAHAFREQILALAEKHPNVKVHFRYNQPCADDLSEGFCHSKGLVDAELIESLIPDRDADFYFCGPKPFMVNIYHHLLEWGVPPTQVHLEFFGPRQELEKPKPAVA